MANNVFDRTSINLRERPNSSDINQLQSQSDRTLRDLLMHTLLGRNSATSDISGNPVTGFFGDGFKVRQASPLGLSVTVTAGIGFLDLPGDVPYATPALASAVGGVVGLDDLSRYKPLALLSPVTILGIPAGPSAGNYRYDIVEVRMNRVLGNPTSRDILNVGTGVFDPMSVNKTLAMTLDGSTGTVTSPASSTAAVSYKVGVNNSAEPSVTPGYVKIATIYSNNGNMTTQVTRGNIIDRRNMLFPGNRMDFAIAGTMPAAGAPSISGLSAPPGIEFVITRIGGVSYKFKVWVIGGGTALAPIAAGNIVNTAYAANKMRSFEITSSAVGTLVSGDVTDLANAAVSYPPLAFAEGTPYAAITCETHYQAAGVTDGTVVDPEVWMLHGFQMRA